MAWAGGLWFERWSWTANVRGLRTSWFGGYRVRDGKIDGNSAGLALGFTLRRLQGVWPVTGQVVGSWWLNGGVGLGASGV